jgi:membrane protein YqaA with SNARE-associated domain
LKREYKTSQEEVDVLKISWVKSSIVYGLILLIIGLTAILVFKVLNVGNIQAFLDAKNLVKDYGLAGIFFATIIAGTILPLGSPALVVAAASFGLNPALLALTAAAGFTIGMTVNYLLAYRLGRPYIVRKMKAEELEATTLLWNRRGWILYVFFGAIPILPVEFLALVCGLLKANIRTFLVLSFAPRFMVFMLLAYFGEALGSWIGFI